MAEGSLYFAWYYFLSTLLFLAITIASFSLLTVSGGCSSTCPLLIPDYPTPTTINPIPGYNLYYSECLCSVPQQLNAYGYTGQTTTGNEQNRYQQIANVVFGNSNGGYTRYKNCYICNSDPSDTQVYQPCASYEICTLPNLNGFQVASINDSTLCNTQSNNVTNANILISPSVGLRSFVIATLYAIAVFYLIMTIAACVCAIGYNTFKSKYGSDWGKLTRIEKWLGVCCKIFPIITRVANILVLFFILLSIISMFSYKVCISALNGSGITEFYNEVPIFIAFVSISWLVTCIFGSIFQKLVPRDTSFYNPPFPLDTDADACQKCCSRTGFFFAHYGP